MRALQLCLRVRVVGSHIFQPTVQNAAELVEGVGADIPVFAQSIQLAGADFVFFDAFILREAFFFIVFQSSSNEIIRHTVQSLHSVIEWQGRTRRLTITRKRAIILSKKGFGKRIL